MCVSCGHDFLSTIISPIRVYGACPRLLCPTVYSVSTIGFLQARRRTRFARREGWTSSRRCVPWTAPKAPEVAGSGVLVMKDAVKQVFLGAPTRER